MELAEDRVQWQALVLAVLNLLVLLPDSYLISKADFSRYVDPSHHDMARPQFANGRTASNMESSFEYIQ
jgi:hypothetical protein